MLTLNDALQGLEDPHLSALLWFNDNRGRRVSWAEMKEHADQGVRLSSAPKGIYKPSYTDHALSVRTLQDGPYPDKDVEYRPDGSWTCQYFQERHDPSERDKSAGNRGLMLCMEQRIPVGFLIKRQDKPRAEYDVLGLGFVTNWEKGYFTISGLADNGELNLEGIEQDATAARAKVLSVSEPQAPEGELSDQDLREFALSLVAKRRGQAGFRNALIGAYGARCCITGCDVLAGLEAAHISPYRGDHSNGVHNGLLLRADIHSLFDQGFLAIDGEYRVLLEPKIGRSEHYGTLHGSFIALPENEGQRPSLEALTAHRIWAGL
jgi:hypothetical protein